MNGALQHWSVEGWLANPHMGGSGHAFRLWASPRFLEVAAEIVEKDGWSPERFITSTNYIIGEAFPHVLKYPAPNEGKVQFGEVGLQNWAVPGSCSCMGIDFGVPKDWREKGVEYQPHNVDGPLQQSVLMAIWMLWAQAVEASFT